MTRKSKLEFIREQGYASDERLYSELMLQPRVVAVVAAAGLITQQPWLFVGLGIALFGSVMTPSPAPRRFSAALGGGIALATGAALGAQLTVAAWILEVFIVVSLASVLVRRFCVPAYVYRLLTSGGTKPAATNDGAIGRGENRRVELVRN
jgi:hypothetical protein